MRIEQKDFHRFDCRFIRFILIKSNGIFPSNAIDSNAIDSLYSSRSIFCPPQSGRLRRHLTAESAVNSPFRCAVFFFRLRGQRRRFGKRQRSGQRRPWRPYTSQSFQQRNVSDTAPSRLVLLADRRRGFRRRFHDLLGTGIRAVFRIRHHQPLSWHSDGHHTCCKNGLHIHSDVLYIFECQDDHLWKQSHRLLRPDAHAGKSLNLAVDRFH